MILTLLARFWFVPVIAVLVGVLGLQTMRIDRLKGDLTEQRSIASQLAVAKEASERARRDDNEVSKRSYQELDERCSLAFSRALETGKVIERVIWKPAPAGGGRPVISDGELRSVYGQAKP